MTVARIWRGATRAEDRDRYVDYLEGTGIADYLATPGNLGVEVLTRVEGDRAHFTIRTLWESLDAIRAFAGDDVEVPDAFVDDTQRLTWRAYARSGEAARDYREDGAPYLRVQTARVPLLAVIGEEDDRVREESSREWELVLRGRVVRMPGVGHTPQWERPGATARLLASFAAPLLRPARR